MSASTPAKPKRNLAMHLLAGGVAGCCEAVSCHPLDTIKVRLQLRGERQVRNKPIASTDAFKEVMKVNV